MEILGNEINIYVVIVAVVGIFVTTVILVIASNMGKKRQAGSKNKKNGSKLTNSAVRGKNKPQKTVSPKQKEKTVRPQLIKPPGKSADKDSTRKEPDETGDSLLGNPQDGSPADLSTKPDKKSQPGYSPGETVDMATAVGGSAVEESKGGGASSLLFDPGQPDEKKAEGEKPLEETKPPENAGPNEESKPPENPEEPQGKKGAGSLMDIFEEEDLEESEATALASLLTDVDLSTLNKLSEEMSQVLLKHRTGRTGGQ